MAITTEVLSGHMLLINSTPVTTGLLSGQMLLINNTPITTDILPGKVLLRLPTYSYYMISETAGNIEPPEEPI